MNITEHLTTAQAAKRAKVSRPTISRALKWGELIAIRDNAGRWMIDPAAVDEWAEKRTSVHPVQGVHRSHSVQDAPQAVDDERLERLRADLAQSREAVARLEGEAAMNKERLADLAADRDRWRAMAERLSQPEIVRPVGGGGRGGFLSRLLSRSRG